MLVTFYFSYFPYFPLISPLHTYIFSYFLFFSHNRSPISLQYLIFPLFSLFFLTTTVGLVRYGLFSLLQCQWSYLQQPPPQPLKWQIQQRQQQQLLWSTWLWFRASWHRKSNQTIRISVVTVDFYKSWPLTYTQYESVNRSNMLK